MPRSVKVPNPIDVQAGGRLRLRRTVLGSSQTELGNAVGVTFQQVQKYEKGTNRIGASRLHQVARVLRVPIEFFFEEPAGLTLPREGILLVEAILRIKDRELRQKIVARITELADDSSQ